MEAEAQPRLKKRNKPDESIRCIYLSHQSVLLLQSQKPANECLFPLSHTRLNQSTLSGHVSPARGRFSVDYRDEASFGNGFKIPARARLVLVGSRVTTKYSNDRAT